jgi:purine catabolism regulator
MPTRRVTVLDVLALPVLKGAALVAGEAGSSRGIDGVSVMADPQTLDHVPPGYLVLASSYTLAPEGDGLTGLVRRLVDQSIAGLVFKPGDSLAHIPESMRTLADDLGFPIVQVPEDVPLNDIAAAVLAAVLDHQATRLQRAAEIHERFTEVILTGGATRDVAMTLGRFLDRRVTVVDPAGSVVATAPPGAEPVPARDGDAATGILEHPIEVEGERFGTLIVDVGPDGLDDEGRVAVERAAVAIALRQVQARALAEAHESFIAVSLEELVSGQLRDRETLNERAATLGWDLEPPRAVVLAMPDAPASAAPAETTLRVLAAATRAALGPDAIVWVRSRGVAALVAPASPDPADRRRLVAALQREAAARLDGVTVGIGAGRPVADPLDLATSLREAALAFDVGRWQEGAGASRLFDDLGVERLLLSSPEADLDGFVDQTLGPLLEYDRSYEGELVATLQAWIDTRSVAETARRVFAHYNTIRKRLERIEELLGPVLADSRRLLDLAVALRLLDRSQDRS